MADGDTNSTPEQMLSALSELREQNEELRRANSELEAARALQFSHCEVASDGYFTINDAGVIQDASLAACTLLGVPTGGLDKQSIVRFISEVDLPVFDRHRQLLTESGDPKTCELQMIRSDASKVWVRLLSTIDSSRDGIVLLRVSISDITSRKQFDETLIEREQLFTNVLEATKDGIWDWNVETDHVYLSPQWSRLLGYEPGELGEHVDVFYKLLHPDDQDRVNEQIRLHFSGQTEEKQSEVRLRMKTGEYRWFLDRGKAIAFDVDGNPTRMVGTITDIQERKKTESLREEAELRIREREARLRKAQAISKIGNFHWNAATDKVEWSDELFRIYGREPGSFIPCFAGYVEAVHADDRFFVVQALQKAMESLSEFDHEYRVIRPDGQMIWVHAIGSAITEAGVLVGLEGTCQDISERKSSEDARREAHERLQKIASRLPGVVFQMRMDLDGNASFPYTSDGMKELFGICPSELTEDASRLFALHHADDREAIMKTLEVSRRDLSPWLHEFRLRFPDGTMRWVSVNSKPEREVDGSTHWHGYAMDTTERKRTEETLRWNQSLLQMMSNSSPLGFLVVDNRTDAILYFNSRFCEIWGIEDLAQGMRDGVLSSEDIEPRCLQVLADVPAFRASSLPLQDESNRITLEDEIAFKDDRVVRRFSTQIRDESDHYYGRFYIFEDITARKQAEAERDSLQAQLRESQKMEAIGTLAGGIAHDFNNILAVILGNAELAESLSYENASLGEFLGEIRQAGIRARELVQQILSFSRQQPTALQPISLADIVHESVSLLRATLPARLKLNVHCQANLPLVLADATQLQQVIINLATNSMQAIGSQAGEISIRLERVALSAPLAETNSALREMHSAGSSHVLHLSITDSGQGMSSATTERIFEPFFTTKPVGKGTGLGLAVVHGIVTAHNGSIVAESQEGQGATFSIYLQPCLSRQYANDNDVNHGRGSAESHGAHILFLDDNETVLTVTQSILEVYGFRVSAFASQQEALDAIRDDPTAFDLVVTDYNMPGMSGLDVSRVVREIRPSLPVAVTSGFVDEELRENAAAAGVLELISKPFLSSELIGKIERLVAVSAVE